MFLRNVSSHRTTRRYIPENDIIRNYRSENLKIYDMDLIIFGLLGS
jgi:hypothetical protein